MHHLRFIFPLLLATTLALADGPTHRFRPVAAGIPTEDMESVRELLSTGQFARAAEKFSPFLADPAGPLARMDGDAVISLPAWIGTLPAEERKGLTDAWRVRFEAAAREALGELRARPAAAPREFYAIARKHPLSSLTGEACAEAGRRSAARGDAQGALAYYRLARDAGWSADAGQAAMVEACTDLLKRVADPSAYRGPIAFDATWFNQAAHIHLSRYHPHAHDGIFYIAAARHLLAMRETGQILWQWSSPDAWSPAFTPDKLLGLGRGAEYAPAIFAAPAGPQVLVVRQPGAGGRDFTLRAFRATDGKLLWRTDALPALQRFSIASSPAIAGDSVHVVAVQYTEESATLVLLALDLLDGSTIFACPLGNMLDMRQSRAPARQWDGFWEQSEPAIDGECVYLTPNVGMTFCVGRFDGRIRWARAYDPALRGFASGNGRPARADLRAEPAPPPRDEEQLLRYRTTPALCGRVLVIAPQDTPSSLGLDAGTGALLWQANPPAHTLIGGTAGRVLFAGRTMAGIDPATGRPAWFFTPPRPAFISGPPALVAGVLYVPASDVKIHTLDPQTGTPAASAPKHPNFRLLVHSANGQKALADAQVLPTLGVPNP